MRMHTQKRGWAHRFAQFVYIWFVHWWWQRCRRLRRRRQRWVHATQHYSVRHIVGVWFDFLKCIFTTRIRTIQHTMNTKIHLALCGTVLLPARRAQHTRFILPRFVINLVNCVVCNEIVWNYRVDAREQSSEPIWSEMENRHKCERRRLASVSQFNSELKIRL